MVAKRKIKAGDEVSDNYGIHYLSLTVEERQEQRWKRDSGITAIFTLIVGAMLFDWWDGEPRYFIKG